MPRWGIHRTRRLGTGTPVSSRPRPCRVVPGPDTGWDLCRGQRGSPRCTCRSFESRSVDHNQSISIGLTTISRTTFVNHGQPRAPITTLVVPHIRSDSRSFERYVYSRGNRLEGVVPSIDRVLGTGECGRFGSGRRYTDDEERGDDRVGPVTLSHTVVRPSAGEARLCRTVSSTTMCINVHSVRTARLSRRVRRAYRNSELSRWNWELSRPASETVSVRRLLRPRRSRSETACFETSSSSASVSSVARRGTSK